MTHNKKLIYIYKSTPSRWLRFSQLEVLKSGQVESTWRGCKSHVSVIVVIFSALNLIFMLIMVWSRFVKWERGAKFVKEGVRGVLHQYKAKCDSWKGLKTQKATDYDGVLGWKYHTGPRTQPNNRTLWESRCNQFLPCTYKLKTLNLRLKNGLWGIFTYYL